MAEAAGAEVDLDTTPGRGNPDREAVRRAGRGGHRYAGRTPVRFALSRLGSGVTRPPGPEP